MSRDLNTTQVLVHPQECINHINVIRGTYGGTFGYENSGPHNDVPLDPKSLRLIWDTGASYGLIPFQSDFIDQSLLGMLLKSIPSSV